MQIIENNKLNFKLKKVTTMKKMISFLTLIVIATMSFAQSATELAEQQRKQNEVQMKQLNMKPSPSAKIAAKKLKKEGWEVPAGETDMALQITKAQLMGEELMTDEEGNPTKRYYQHTAIVTSGAYNTGFAAARANALTEVASMMKTQLVAAWKAKNDNSQNGSTSVTSNEKFNQRIGGIVDETITNAIPTVKIYRRLNNNFEVQIRMAFDKKELAARLKRAMQKELEVEGDQLNGMVDEMLSSKF